MSCFEGVSITIYIYLFLYNLSDHNSLFVYAYIAIPNVKKLLKTLFLFFLSFLTEKPSSSYQGSDLEGSDSSIWSEVTDEGLLLTQYLTEHGFAGVELSSESEELVLNISSRLQAAVEKLLEAINETTNQVAFFNSTLSALFEIIYFCLFHRIIVLEGLYKVILVQFPACSTIFS